VQARPNGARILPAILESIRNARETFTFGTYIYWSGEIGREVSGALSERTRAGVGIANQWQGDGDSKEHGRDSHFRMEGPVVARMQAAFTDNWIKTRGVVICGSMYFPEPRPVGGSGVIPAR
jgi:phosphatidylserine/phosphatidylglycerophosphate/cardiolipin synthase-like enzyme